jgi:hypothetical protein
MTNPPHEADDFSIGENATQIVQLDDNDQDDAASGDAGVDDGYKP